MNDKEIKIKLKELSEKIDILEHTLSELSKPYNQLIEYIEKFQNISSGYLRLMYLYSKYGAISPEIIIPKVKDSISKEIVRILFEKSDLNISEITERLKARRGKASRRIVKHKLQALEKLEVIDRTDAKKSKRYRISEEIVTKWSKVLGLVK